MDKPANRFYGEQRVEIKEGTYGIVNVSRGPFGTDETRWVGVASDIYTAEELREAAHLFVQLAEALERD